MTKADRELAVRIVDQVVRGIRRDGLLAGTEAGTESRRRLEAACPWAYWHPSDTDRKAADPRWVAYQREADAAMTRLFAPAAGPVTVEAEGGAPLVVPAELESWAAARGVQLRAPKPAGKAAEPADGPETLDMFAGGAV